MKKVLVGMSGGVDSTTAVLLLQKAGYEVLGLTLCLSESEEKMQSARRAAEELGISHAFLPMEDEFRAEVMQPFRDAYFAGKTPNPCVLCNAKIKLAALFSYADAHGIEFVATGHYARVCEKNGETLLCRGADEKKDQTYFLSQIPRAWLPRLVLPLSDMTKSEVRTAAENADLAAAKKPDSLDICFIPGGDYIDFIEKNMPHAAKEGKILDENGYMVGIHTGVHRYTIGQRKGLGAFGRKVFVTDIDAKNNTVTIGDNAALQSRGLYADEFNAHLADFPAVCRVNVKIRSAAPPVPATCRLSGDGAEILFDTPQRAVTPGQTVAIYDEDILIGGATIVQRIGGI